MRHSILYLCLLFVLCLPSVYAQQPAPSPEPDAAHIIVGPHGITRAQACTLSLAYFFRCINLCGGPDQPVEHEGYWSAEAVVGYMPTSRGFIRVDKNTGAVSFPGKPTLLPKDFATSSQHGH